MFKKALLASAVALAIASPAHALVQVSNFDWVTPFGTFDDIAKFTLSGSATVSQEINTSGNPFVGAHFSEFGGGFALQYTDKNGAPGSFGKFVFFDFVGMSGLVSQVNPDGSFNYVFNPLGHIDVSYGTSKGSAISWFSANVAGINGSVGNSIGLNVKGTSEVLALLPAASVTNTFFDENNQSLNWFQNGGGLFFDAVLTNSIKGVVAPVACSFDQTKVCTKLAVDSEGPVTLYRVPEPASLALLGVGLLGAGIARRRKVVAN